MKYLLILIPAVQGCEYTIDCGVKYEFIDLPEDGQELRKKLKEKILEFTGESKLATAMLVKASDVSVLPVEKWYGELEFKQHRESSILKEKEERALLETLKKKYE